MGSHFASKPMGARSREARAKIFANGEIPVQTTSTEVVFLYNENPAIVAGFYIGCADEQKNIFAGADE